MRQSKWEMEKTKSKGVGGVWPLAFFLIFSSYFHSFGSSPPHFSLCQSHTCARLSMFCQVFKDLKRCHKQPGSQKAFTDQFILIVVLVIKPTPDSSTYSMLLVPRNAKLAISCVALNSVAIWFACRSINKNTHGQTRLIKGSMSCKEFVVKSCVAKFFSIPQLLVISR